ncbi:unnamed protein product [Symbiodinium natans]|uniref:Uncharacterized protein n=1 Tax=Symbiodinium natans TaxID=878477 RepID=A0A812IN75_9DINO|nr:unnamed protein product [Symbiodinium natans]
MIKSSKPASFSSGIMLSRSEAQRQKGDELRMRAAGIDPTKVDEQWAGEVMSRRQKKEAKVDEEQEREKKEAADLPMEKSEVVGKRPDGRLKWLHKALVLASKGRIAAPAIYDIVQSSKFTAGVGSKVGMQMKGLVLANLHLFKKEQQKSLQNGRLMDFSGSGGSASRSPSPKKRKKEKDRSEEEDRERDEPRQKKSKKEKSKDVSDGHFDKSEVLSKKPSSRLRWLHEALVEAINGRLAASAISEIVRSSKFASGLGTEVMCRTQGLVLANLHLFEEEDREELQRCRLLEDLNGDADSEDGKADSDSYSRSPTPKKKRKKDKSEHHEDAKHREKDKDKSSKKKH